MTCEKYLQLSSQETYTQIQYYTVFVFFSFAFLQRQNVNRKNWLLPPCRVYRHCFCCFYQTAHRCYFVIILCIKLDSLTFVVLSLDMAMKKKIHIKSRKGLLISHLIQMRLKQNEKNWKLNDLESLCIQSGTTISYKNRYYMPSAWCTYMQCTCCRLSIT